MQTTYKEKDFQGDAEGGKEELQGRNGGKHNPFKKKP